MFAELLGRAHWYHDALLSATFHFNLVWTYAVLKNASLGFGEVGGCGINIPLLCFSLRHELCKSKHFVLLMKEMSHVRKNVFRPCHACWVLSLFFLPLGHGRAGGCWSGKSCWNFQLQPWADRKNLEQARAEIQACKQPGKLISDPQVNVLGFICFVWGFFFSLSIG